MLLKEEAAAQESYGWEYSKEVLLMKNMQFVLSVTVSSPSRNAFIQDDANLLNILISKSASMC